MSSSPETHLSKTRVPETRVPLTDAPALGEAVAAHRLVLSARVATQVMGWQGLSARKDSWNVPKIWGQAPIAGGQTLFSPLPSYEYSDSESRLAELRLIRAGYGPSYALALRVLVEQGDLGLLTATPEQRCTAMIAVLDGRALPARLPEPVHPPQAGQV